MRRVITIIILLCTVAYAASTAGSYLENPVSVRSLALGSCSAAQIDGSSFYKNPASARLQSFQAINLTQGKVLSDVNYLALNYVQPDVPNYNFGFGFSLLNAGVDGIPEATYDDTTKTAQLTGNNFSYRAYTCVLAFSKDLNDRFFVGTNLKILQESMLGHSSSGAGLDLGVLYRFDDKILLGLSVLNALKPNIAWDTGDADKPNTKLITGVSYQYTPQLQLLADLTKEENQNAMALVGLEYKPFAVFSFRVGFANNHLTLGTGLSYSNLLLDYAFIDNAERTEAAAITQYISISLQLGNVAELSWLEDKEKSDKALEDAIQEEKRLAALKGKNLPSPSANASVSVPTRNLTPTGTAEIKPLPLPEPQKLPEELITQNITVSRNTSNVAALPPIEVTPIIDTSNEAEATVNLVEDVSEPVYDYNITLISARYYQKSMQLQCKVFIDNAGNRQDTISANFRIMDNKGQTLRGFSGQSGTLLKSKQSLVFYYLYALKNPLPVGTYYMETKTESSGITKYQKEKYIRR